jgi:hypothetical protein
MKSIIILFLTIATTGASLRCAKTGLGGPQENRSCIFPFTIENTTYNECTRNHDRFGRFWCSTKVDDFGNHVTLEDEWGYCDESKNNVIFNISLCLHKLAYNYSH